MFVVPAQRLWIGAAQIVGWREDRLAVMLVVVPPVVELLLDAAAHFEAKVGRDGYIARIEQAVDVAPKQETVSGLVFAAVAIGPDMRGFEPARCARG